jgi:hypothetical protein
VLPRQRRDARRCCADRDATRCTARARPPHHDFALAPFRKRYASLGGTQLTATGTHSARPSTPRPALYSTARRAREQIVSRHESEAARLGKARRARLRLASGARCGHAHHGARHSDTMALARPRARPPLWIEHATIAHRSGPTPAYDRSSSPCAERRHHGSSRAVSALARCARRVSPYGAQPSAASWSHLQPPCDAKPLHPSRNARRRSQGPYRSVAARLTPPLRPVGVAVAPEPFEPPRRTLPPTRRYISTGCRPARLRAARRRALPRARSTVWPALGKVT